MREKTAKNQRFSYQKHSFRVKMRRFSDDFFAPQLPQSQIERFPPPQGRKGAPFGEKP
jgi:hypothetical protein